MGHLLLDIDGVLSPFLGFNLTEKGFVPLSTGSTTWLLSDVHKGYVEALRGAGHRLVWCSAWEEDSHLVTTHWGIERFAEAIIFDPHYCADDLKLFDVRGYVDRYPGERVVWVDDEHGCDTVLWASGLDNVLLVPCNPAIGLTYDQFVEIQRFLSAPASSSVI